MKDYFNLAQLPVLSSERQSLQVSSFDRKYDNADFGQFLYEKDGSQVMFDDKGRGCIKSIWSAVVTEESMLSFYFDGSDEPQFTVSLKGLFTGEIGFLSGLGNSLEERGHYDGADCVAGNCFIPIPYNNGLKITASGKTDFYYHIMYEKYNNECDPVEAFKTLGENYLQAFSGIRTTEKGETFKETVTLNPGYTTVYDVQQSGVFTEFTVEAASDADLSNIRVDILWDNDRISQVAAPLEYLFSQPFGFAEIHTHAIETYCVDNKKVMSLFLPMPYWKAANICFVNLSEKAVDLTLKLSIAKNTYIQEETGYFCADFKKGVTELFSDWLIGDFCGQGNIVGIIQTCHGGQYCEGNEHFYINGAKTPQINGTGTEDLYLACYWPNLKFDSPCAGCVNDVYLMNDGTLKGSFKYPAGYYRFFHDMPISFIDGIKLCVQHGAVNQTYSDYSSLCLSYRRNESLSTQTDYINIENEASREMHEYKSDCCKVLSLQSKIESDMKGPVLNRKGFIHRKGKIKFKIAIEPENNGIYLRRLYDQSVSPQEGNIYVDGNSVGKWYNPGYNGHYSFADNDFFIPASFCAGKKMLDIEIDVSSVFSDFEYKVFSVKNIQK